MGKCFIKLKGKVCQGIGDNGIMKPLRASRGYFIIAVNEGDKK